MSRNVVLVTLLVGAISVVVGCGGLPNGPSPIDPALPPVSTLPPGYPLATPYRVQPFSGSAGGFGIGIPLTSTGVVEVWVIGKPDGFVNVELSLRNDENHTVGRPHSTGTIQVTNGAGGVVLPVNDVTNHVRVITTVDMSGDAKVWLR